MHPKKVRRNRVKALTDLPNIGPALEADLQLLGISEASQLCGRCPYAMYDELIRLTQIRQDPCVLDVFISITHFMNGGKAKPWWEFTAQRKQTLASSSA